MSKVETKQIYNRESKDKWTLLRSYFEEIGLVRQHLDSFNVFLEDTLQQIVDESKKIIPDIPDFYIIFGKLRVEKPAVREADGATKAITPLEARIRELTYGSKLFLEMTPVSIDERTQRPHYNETIDTYIGKLPIMLKSSICPLSKLKTAEELIKIGEDPLDPGGYFIINGTERALVTQEDLAPNRILIDEASKSSSATHIAKVFSTTHGFRAPVTIERRKDGNVRISLPSVPGKIPIAVLMRVLGLRSDKKIFEAISNNPEIQKELIPIIDVASAIEVTFDPDKSQMNALDYVGKHMAVGQTKEYRIKRAQQILDRYLLPHIGYEKEDRIKKAYYLGQMTQKVLELALDIRRPDDKDHYANKRLKLAGDLFTSLFRVSFLNLARDIKYQLERTAVRGRKPNIKTAVRADVITERIRHALATGNWVGGKAGVSQLLDRTNYISTLSHLRRIISPLSRSQPHFEARDLHPTQWGKICPAETPEGPNCGLVKNLALTALISVGTNSKVIEAALYDLGVIPIDEVDSLSGKAKIFLNGRLLGIHPNYKPLIETIRTKRRRGDLNKNVNIAFYPESNEIQINCDAGRARRPLLVVKNGKVLLQDEDIKKILDKEEKWNDLIDQGLIEYFDADEEENAYVAMTEEVITKEHTHVEIAPAAILGITASLIPFPDHNQSPRNTYEAGMAKQALGIFAANFHLRLDTRGHLLHYPQKPLTSTRAMNIIGFETRPAGQNFVLGIMSFQAFNIEDALIINKASVERGLSRSTFFRTYEGEERKYPGGQLDKFEVPEKEVRGYRASDAYRHLADDGIIEPETDCNGGDVLIGRTSPPRFTHPYDDFDDLSQPQRRETSINMRRHSEKGIVDTVLITETLDGNKLIKIKTRDLRIPELGDKFASRHGQKGVLGLISPQEDMPFSAEGIVPDMIINPHAMPSRMTLGQMFEGCLGKVAAANGTIENATPFEMENMDELQQQLVKHGFDYGGRETFYNGVTGEKYDVGIYFACIYYQKLHHLVADKIHARARGPVQILTRQPTEGRAREGGLRFGEMERDCLVGHGSSVLLKERLLDESDKTTILVCQDCGLLGIYDRNRDRTYCPICGEKSIISSVTCSYAFKLLLQEMTSLGLAPRLILKDRA